MKERDRYRKAIETQVCPECGKGPYKSLPQHMAKAHEIDRFEFRNRAEVSKRTRISSPEVSENARRRAIKENMGERVVAYSKSIKGTTGVKREIPEHSLRRISSNLKKYNASLSEEERRLRAKRASDSRTQAGIKRQSEAMKQWHADNPMTDEHKKKLLNAYRDPETQEKLAAASMRRRKPCGTVAAYKRGCRCDPCRQAKSLKAKEEYRKKK